MIKTNIYIYIYIYIYYIYQYKMDYDKLLKNAMSLFGQIMNN